MTRRVVITGMGLVTPLGVGRELCFNRLVAGQSGATLISRFDTSDYGCKIACEIPYWSEEKFSQEGLFKPSDYLSPKELKKIDDFILYAIAAADEAIADSGLTITDEEEAYRAGVMIGSGIGGLGLISETALELKEKGPRRISPFFIPASLINLASGQVSIRHGLKGPNHAVVTACATGAHAIGDGARLIKYGDADVMVVGGAESAIVPLGIAGFLACRALSTSFNDHPTQASRPFDKDRDGFVMGEGAGILVLEEYEHAKKRGAKIYAEIKGYGLSGDAHHITAPSEDGDGGYRAMRMALKDSGLDVSEIDYINAHGTSTMADTIELGAIERFWHGSEHLKFVSSTKSSIGHLLGAAGAVEAIFCVMALRDQIMPPTLNLDNPSVETKIDLVPHKAKSTKLRNIMSNSFGFGGTNAALILGIPK